MKAIVKEAIEAGALGFSTSRTLAHVAIDGEPVPGTFAAEDELFASGAALGELGTGIFELAPVGAAGEDVIGPKKEVDWMRRLSAAMAGRSPSPFSRSTATGALERVTRAHPHRRGRGGTAVAQVAGRPFGLLTGHHTTTHSRRHPE